MAVNWSDVQSVDWSDIGQEKPRSLIPSQQDINQARTKTELGIQERKLKDNRIKRYYDAAYSSPQSLKSGQLGKALWEAPGAAWETAESVPANIGLGIQRGASPREIALDVYQGVRGERPAQMGDILRASGSPVLEKFAAPIGMAVMPGGAQIQAMGVKAIQKAPQAISSIAKGGMETGRGAWKFLTGSPEAREASVQQLRQKAHEMVQSFRLGGERSGKFYEMLERESDKAWKPMDQVARAVKEPISLSELENLAASKYGQDPIRMKEIQGALRQTFQEPPMAPLFDQFGRPIQVSKDTFSVPEMLDKFRELGRSLTHPEKAGSVSRGELGQLAAELRSLVAEAVSSKAPPGLEQNFQQALVNWKNYATFRDQVWRLLRPGQVKGAATESGESWLKRSAGAGQISPSKSELMGEFTRKFGEDITAPLIPYVKEVKKSARKEAVGKWLGRATAATGATGGAVGVGKTVYDWMSQ